MRLSHKFTTALVLASMFALTACENKPTEEKPTEATATEATDKKADGPKIEADKKAPGAAAAADKKADEKKADEKATVSAKVGEAAPDFALKDQDGKEHKLSDLKGKIVVLEWTEPGCPFVVRHYEADTMTNLAKSVGDDVVWLAVDSSHFAKADEVNQWREKEGVAYPVLLDTDGKVGQVYQAKTTPHMFVVDKEGVLRYSGAIDDNPRGDKKEGVTNYVDAAVGALKEGKDVATPETKPYGCSVKYGS